MLGNLEIAGDIVDLLALLQDRLPQAPPTDAKGAVALTVAGESSPHLLHPPDAVLTAAADQLLRARSEWLDVPGTGEQVADLCVRVLRSLGFTDQLAGRVCGSVQLTFSPDAPVEVTAFPWEFAIAEATRERRTLTGTHTRQALLIYRYLDGGSTAPPTGDPASLLVLENAPGRLASTYTFESERRLVESALGFETIVRIDSPTLREIGVEIGAAHPDVIHVAGIDARQGRALLGLPSIAGPADGLFICDEAGEATVVPYSDLAIALRAGGGPRLVALNLYNSQDGAREAVRAGAHAAIGFQDEIDDLCAEQFFARFYSEWRATGWDLLAAYQAAWLALAPYAAKIRGTGIVLWTSQPLLKARTPGTRRGTGSGTGGGGTVTIGTGSGGMGSGSTGTGGAGTGAGGAVLPPTAALPYDVTDAIDVEYEAPKSLNYSLLHNNGNIIPKLVIRRQKAGTFRPITVQVTVSAGTEQATYRTTLTVNDQTPKIDLHDLVRIPLTSQLTRTLDEGMISTIYLLVKLGDHVVKECTDRVTFMPIDEWRYDDTSAKWLPSFVFPRDPAVRKVIASAQRYLIALRDDSTAGFDGYQSVDAKGATLTDRCRYVDAQVQALWWALVIDYRLGYINPPPNYTDSAQRLRTPSEILDGGRGTCIDLALLLAACLEYVEIYPAIFMLNDHAFPGYWRCDDSHTQLATRSLKAAATTAGSGTVVERETHPDPWMIGRGRFGDVTALVNEGHVVPLETVNLTTDGSFWAAAADGVANLRNKRHFYALYDMRTARTPPKNVTPLPLWSKRL